MTLNLSTGTTVNSFSLTTTSKLIPHSDSRVVNQPQKPVPDTLTLAIGFNCKKWSDLIEEEAKGNCDAINEKGVDLFVNVNNHYEGSTPLTIGRVRG